MVTPIEAQYMAAQVITRDVFESGDDDLQLCPNLQVRDGDAVVWFGTEIGRSREIRRAVDFARLCSQLGPGFSSLWGGVAPGMLTLGSSVYGIEDSIEFALRGARLVIDPRQAFWQHVPQKALSGSELFHALGEWAKASQN